jgi:hypothetical protein
METTEDEKLTIFQSRQTCNGSNLPTDAKIMELQNLVECEQ